MLHRLVLSKKEHDMNNTHPATAPTVILSFLKLSVMVLLTTLMWNGGAHAQTPAPTPDSEEVQKLKEEKAKSELRRGIAEDKKAELEATFPKPKTTPLEGKTEVDSGVKLESEILAYRQM